MSDGSMREYRQALEYVILAVHMTDMAQTPGSIQSKPGFFAWLVMIEPCFVSALLPTVWQKNLQNMMMSCSAARSSTFLLLYKILCHKEMKVMILF